MTELNKETFQDAINNSKPVVIDFWAEWCMPCKMFAPVLEEISDELDGKAEFYKVNVDDNMELAQKYAVASIPTVIIYQNGTPVERMVGLQPKEQVIAAVEKYVG